MFAWLDPTELGARGNFFAQRGPDPSSDRSSAPSSTHSAKAAPPEREPSPTPCAAETVYVTAFWRRLAAGALDALALLPILVAAAWVITRLGGLELFPDGRRGLGPEQLLDLVLGGTAAFYGLSSLLIGLAILFSVAFIATSGATPGLRLVQSRVITIYGDRPEWWRAALRACAKLVGLLLLGVGPLWAAFDREKRGLHDWVAGTYVVDDRMT